MNKIDYSGILRIAEKRGHSLLSASKACGIKYQHMRSIAKYNHDPMTDDIVAICINLHCTPEDVMKFDFEFKHEDYKCALKEGGVLTYDPLRLLIIDNARAGKAPTTMKEFYKLLQRQNNWSEENRDKVTKAMLESRGIDFDEVQKNGPRRRFIGASANIRAKINNDRPVRVSIIYEICKVLNCSPNSIIGIK